MSAGDDRTLGDSDWEDEDLLNHEEAAERLRKEIAVEEAVIRDAGDDPESPTVERARARLAAMHRHLERADAALATGAGRPRRIEWTD